MWCQPIFGVVGCFMKCTLKGQLLAAVGRDANNGMYPFAWAVVDVENEENWTWFFKLLKADFNLQEGQGYTIISDRQKGLLNAVQNVFPHIEHRMCARHIYGNLKKLFPNQSDMKALFWRVAESFTEPEYRANIESVKNYDIRLYEAMMEKNPQNCSLAYFSPAASCVDVHNNISESFNNAIDPARYMPMVEMLETIRRKTMVRIDQRMKEGLNHQGRFTVRAVEWIEAEQKKLRYCVMVPGANARDEMPESGVSYSVNMRLKTCACRRWDMSGLPCRHALRIIAERKLNHEDHISHWFLNSRQQQIYGYSINPVNGMLFWGRSGSKVLPPPSLVEEIENRVGRKPKPKKRRQGMSLHKRRRHLEKKESCIVVVVVKLATMQPNVRIWYWKPAKKQEREQMQERRGK
ncbi:uncharacterized protein LOC112088162 [Eutrema salsugineum]|uniref:uncharacterized protein LOC112088162 n=1 Tax=Eutrema salsugineum TaxID=72664 RepID=UPI000CED6074|nr:uncharacterized protein LOC112088162 [Eutrema salsugineum]